MSRTRAIDDADILDRAAAVFWHHGYAASSMRVLAEATGLGGAALYHRFGDKDGLFVAALRRYAEEGLGERLARLSALADPVAAVCGFFDELIRLSVGDRDRRGCLLVNTALDGAAMSPAARAVVRDRLGEIEAFFRHQLGRARQTGRLAADLDPDLTAELLLGTVLSIRVMARLDPDHGRLRRLADGALIALKPCPEDPPR